MVFREGACVAGCGCGLSRRGLLSAGLGLALTGAAAPNAAGAAEPARNVVDVHAHFAPPEFKAAGLVGGPLTAWTPERHLADMAAGGVTRSLLSITTPGAPVDGANGRRLMRIANEYGAKLASDHKGRLGFFVHIQPTDTDAALKEIAYGLDTLKANGVGMFTSYGGKYLGDPVFDPVFAELNRRGATVYVHPSAGACCAGALPGIADTIVEYGADTTRAITSYVYKGAARKYPNVKMIWSHSGGAMPFLIERYDFADRNTPALKLTAPDGFRAEIARFFFDVAQASNPVATRALRSVVPARQIVFGSDYPYRTTAEHVAQLEAGKVFDRAELADLYRNTVARSLPGLLA